MHSLWSDEYWVLLMQLYQRKPVGVKPMYSRGMVDLSLELHIPPGCLYEQMFRLRRIDSPMIQRLWDRYGDNPRRLTRDARQLRAMKAFSTSGLFFDGVETVESFEKDFRPLPDRTDITPVMLIVILDLYFRLTPITMTDETPEVAELAQLLKLKPSNVTEVMEIFQICDPYLKREAFVVSPLMCPCQDIWNRYGNDNPEALAALAAQLKDYFK
ncbi:MAG: hypothetical protein IIU87_09195 [Prevotella sp.]|nr:hypothetical protein [Prevotella sp.]